MNHDAVGLARCRLDKVQENAGIRAIGAPLDEAGPRYFHVFAGNNYGLSPGPYSLEDMPAMYFDDLKTVENHENPAFNSVYEGYRPFRDALDRVLNDPSPLSPLSPQSSFFGSFRAVFSRSGSMVRLSRKTRHEL